MNVCDRASVPEYIQGCFSVICLELAVLILQRHWLDLCNTVLMINTTVYDTHSKFELVYWILRTAARY